MQGNTSEVVSKNTNTVGNTILKARRVKVSFVEKVKLWLKGNKVASYKWVIII